MPQTKIKPMLIEAKNGMFVPRKIGRLVLKNAGKKYARYFHPTQNKTDQLFLVEELNEQLKELGLANG